MDSPVVTDPLGSARGGHKLVKLWPTLVKSLEGVELEPFFVSVTIM